MKCVKHICRWLSDCKFGKLLMNLSKEMRPDMFDWLTVNGGGGIYFPTRAKNLDI